MADMRGRSPKPKGIYCVHYKHGASERDGSGRQSQFYTTWVRMRQRCNNPRNPDFSYYGGRGIKHCERWNNFTAFSEDMMTTFKNGLTLERIENNGPYSPTNCRWASRLEQVENRRCTRKITYKGKTQSISKWTQELPIKISWKDLYKRIFTRGWPLEKAFSQPIRVIKK